MFPKLPNGFLFVSFDLFKSKNVFEIPRQGSTSLAFDCPAGNRVTGLLRVVAGSVMELARYRKHVVVTSFSCNWRLR